MLSLGKGKTSVPPGPGGTKKHQQTPSVFCPGKKRIQPPIRAGKRENARRISAAIRPPEEERKRRCHSLRPKGGKRGAARPESSGGKKEEGKEETYPIEARLKFEKARSKEKKKPLLLTMLPLAKGKGGAVGVGYLPISDGKKKGVFKKPVPSIRGLRGRTLEAGLCLFFHLAKEGGKRGACSPP